MMDALIHHMTAPAGTVGSAISEHIPAVLVAGAVAISVSLLRAWKMSIGLSAPLMRSFYEALKEFPELKEAYEIARTGAEAWFTKLFKMGMMGLRAVDDKGNIIIINPTLAIFYAKTRFGWRETETHEVKVSGGLTLDAEAIKRLERNLTLFKREHEKT